MKKIFTLLIPGLMITSAFAQYDPKEDWNSRNREDGIKSGGKRPNGKFDKNDRHNDPRMTYYFTSHEKDMQIAQINRNYDFRIRSVQNRYLMGRHEKKRLVRQLEYQRDYDIKEVMDKFYSKRNLFTNPRRRGYDKW
jgi:hypothetical protein